MPPKLVFQSICLSLNVGWKVGKEILNQSIDMVGIIAGNENRKRINVIMTTTAHQWKGKPEGLQTNENCP